MIRRVVTGEKNGRSVILSDGTPPRTHEFIHAVGMGCSFAWSTQANPFVSIHAPEAITSDTTTIPPPGETRMIVLRIPPDSYAQQQNYDFAAAGSELAMHVPDITAAMEPEHPGVHRTDTIDFVVVLDGEVVLELDDEEVLLQEKDVVIQRGTRHAWRNRSDRSALLAVVLVGSHRGPSRSDG